MIKVFIKGFVISFLSLCGMLYFFSAAINLSFPDIGFIFEQGYQPGYIRMLLSTFFLLSIALGFISVGIKKGDL